MPRPRKPEGAGTTGEQDVEPTLSDIAKSLTSLTATINSVKTSLDSQIAKQKQDAEANIENHKDLKKELADIKKELTEATERADHCDTVNKQQVVHIKALEEKIQDLEFENRHHNVKIEGLKETNNEDIRNVINEFLEALDVNFTVEWCGSIYRLG